jgi:hypothetical protein
MSKSRRANGMKPYRDPYFSLARVHSRHGMREWFFLVLSLLIAAAVAPNPAWYLLADNPRSSLNNAFPIYQMSDWPVISQKATTVVITPITVPSSLAACTSVTFDLPLYRVLSPNASLVASPTALNIYQWRGLRPGTAPQARPPSCPMSILISIGGTGRVVLCGQCGAGDRHMGHYVGPLDESNVATRACLRGLSLATRLHDSRGG